MIFGLIYRNDFDKRTASSGPVRTRIQDEESMFIEDEIRMQPRKIRAKNIGYMGCFLAWYIGCGMFIMNRLRGDDLEILEVEAKERIQLEKMIKKNQRN